MNMQATLFCGQVGRIRAAVEEEGHDPLGGGQSLQLPGHPGDNRRRKGQECFHRDENSSIAVHRGSSLKVICQHFKFTVFHWYNVFESQNC